MPFSVYDPGAVQILSAALADAMRVVNSDADHPLSESEAANHSKRLADNLMRTFDLGERDPAALRRAALEGM